MYRTFYSICFAAIAILQLKPLASFSQCNAPSVISSSNITHNSADIAWSNVSNATSYEYAYLLTNTAPSAGIPSAINAVSLTPLTPGSRYYVYVRAVCSAAVSNWSADSFDTYKECLSPKVKFTSVTSKSAVVYWDTTGTNSFEYWIGFATRDPQTAGTTISIPSLLVGGLMSDTVFKVCVRSKCGPGYYPPVSDWSCDTFRTMKTTPSPPCDSTRNIYLNLSGTTLKASWDPVPGSMNYYYSFQEEPAAIPPASGSLISFFPQTFMVKPGEKYYFCISTDCGSKVSGWHCDSISVPLNMRVVTSPDASLKIFPNPADNLLTVDVADYRKGGSLVLSTSLGTKVYQSHIGSKQVQIEMMNLSPGIYFMRYESADKSEVHKIIKR